MIRTMYLEHNWLAPNRVVVNVRTAKDSEFWAAMGGVATRATLWVLSPDFRVYPGLGVVAVHGRLLRVDYSTAYSEVVPTMAKMMRERLDECLANVGDRLHLIYTRPGLAQCSYHMYLHAGRSGTRSSFACCAGLLPCHDKLESLQRRVRAWRRRRRALAVCMALHARLGEDMVEKICSMI